MASLTIGSSWLLQAKPYAPSLVARHPYAPVRSAISCVRLLCIRAAKLPTGVDAPKEEPKLPIALWGFTQNAERWNSRAAMLGIIGLFIVELIIHKGILQVIGFEVGKGLNLPL